MIQNLCHWVLGFQHVEKLWKTMNVDQIQALYDWSSKPSLTPQESYVISLHGESWIPCCSQKVGINLPVVGYASYGKTNVAVGNWDMHGYASTSPAPGSAKKPGTNELILSRPIFAWNWWFWPQSLARFCNHQPFFKSESFFTYQDLPLNRKVLSYQDLHIFTPPPPKKSYRVKSIMSTPD